MGNLVFQMNDIENGWDGLHHGQRLNSNVFAWVIEYTSSGTNGKSERKVDSGDVALIR